jgi:hypothetical protein
MTAVLQVLIHCSMQVGDLKSDTHINWYKSGNFSLLNTCTSNALIWVGYQSYCGCYQDLYSSVMQVRLSSKVNKPPFTCWKSLLYDPPPCWALNYSKSILLVPDTLHKTSVHYGQIASPFMLCLHAAFTLCLRNSWIKTIFTLRCTVNLCLLGVCEAGTSV